MNFEQLAQPEPLTLFYELHLHLYSFLLLSTPLSLVLNLQLHWVHLSSCFLLIY